MSYDPQREDYQRLALRFAETLDGMDASEATHAFAEFGRRFAQDRDSLPQTDEDRAFHLVVSATGIIDYELPFSTDAQAQSLITHGHQLLDEAISLDPHCYDAVRMKAASDSPSFDGYHAFLAERVDEVRTRCEERRVSVETGPAGERTVLAADLAMRPYLRWLATEAEQALICGRNREALDLARRALELDPSDAADVRFTAALALAKLEDEAGLDELMNTDAAHAHRAPDDGWTQLARIALAHKAHDLSGARDVLGVLLETYPHAAETLIRQSELPDGVFARLNVVPYSEDELILATSEATVLLQEGRDADGRGVFGSWLAEECTRRDPAAARAVMDERVQQERLSRSGYSGGSDEGEGY